MHDGEALSRLQYAFPFLEQKKGQLYADIWARPRNQALLAFDLGILVGILSILYAP